ncbi:PepSY domain-containing protein [Marinobacter oulmenensis]|uniref:Putative membrane protein YkoI n=1 Tax=Marinobacter oulmenensis TaxID=643747 RepID=A0A840U7B6_9GAMM|nr:PepSY domain-containing protein [Marinobacter oulmenensis]MBB5320103.1 putative membrane protein YkoI [Marinobacter oulmenensis]
MKHQEPNLIPRDRFSRRLLLVFGLALCLPFTLQMAAADDDEWRKLHREVEAGRIKPLGDIMDSLQQDWKGDVIDVDIEKEDGRILYEIELLGPEGQVAEFEIDARTGEVLEVEGRNLRSMERQ